MLPFDFHGKNADMKEELHYQAVMGLIRRLISDLENAGALS